MSTEHNKQNEEATEFKGILDQQHPQVHTH